EGHCGPEDIVQIKLRGGAVDHHLQSVVAAVIEVASVKGGDVHASAGRIIIGLPRDLVVPPAEVSSVMSYVIVEEHGVARAILDPDAGPLFGPGARGEHKFELGSIDLKRERRGLRRGMRLRCKKSKARPEWAFRSDINLDLSIGHGYAGL